MLFKCCKNYIQGHSLPLILKNIDFSKILALDQHENLEETEEDIFLDKTDFFDDTLIDEDIISQHLDEDSDLIAATGSKI